MTDLAVTSQIIQSLATYLKRDPASITESHHLRDDLGLDSVAVIELLFEIEDRFKIQIPDQDLAGLSTVGSVAGYVEQRLLAGEGSVKASPKSAAAAKKPSTDAKKKAGAAPKKQAPAAKKAAASKKKAAAPKKASTAKKTKR